MLNWFRRLIAPRPRSSNSFQGPGVIIKSASVSPPYADPMTPEDRDGLLKRAKK